MRRNMPDLYWNMPDLYCKMPDLFSKMPYRFTQMAGLSINPAHLCMKMVYFTIKLAIFSIFYQKTQHFSHLGKIKRFTTFIIARLNPADGLNRRLCRPILMSTIHHSSFTIHFSTFNIHFSPHFPLFSFLIFSYLHLLISFNYF